MATAGKGLPFIGKMGEFLGKVLHPTVQKIGNSRAALEVINKGYFSLNPAPLTPLIVGAGSTDNLLKYTAHNFKPGDVIQLVVTANAIKEFEIVIDDIIDADTVSLAGYLSSSLTAGDTFNALRAISERFDSSGATLATVSSPALSYNRKTGGITTQTQVLEDIDTPNNSRALPVVIHGLDAAVIQVTGDQINIASSHVNDSMRLGDGTTLTNVTLAGELRVLDQPLNTAFGTQADAVATTDTGTFSHISLLKRLLSKLPLIGTQLKAASQSVAFASDLNLVSTANSSIAALGISAVFTGTSEDVSQYAEVRVQVFANVAGTISLQQSPDGTNWDSTDTYVIPAGTGKTFGLGVGAKFFRVVFTNGGTAQASFRLQTIYHTFRTKPSAIAPQDARTNDNDMEEQVSYGMAFNGTTWDRIKTGFTGAVSAVLGYQNVLPVGKYLTTPPTLTNAQWHDLLVDVNGNLKTTISGSLTVGSSALPTGAATEATLAAMSAKLPATLGQKSAAASLAIVSSVEDQALIGALTETAPATDTASSGLNGRLQRIAQRLSSLITLIPTALGQGTMATSFKVVLPSDQIVPTTAAPNSTGQIQKGTLTVSGTATAVPPSNATGFFIKNQSASDSSAIYWEIGGTASVLSNDLVGGQGSAFIPCSTTVSILNAADGSANYAIQWLIK